jgi:DNA-binding NarL/FixJ family response regulator
VYHAFPDFFCHYFSITSMNVASAHMKTVIVAAQRTTLVKGLALYCLEANSYHVVGLAQNTASLLRRMREFSPDVVVIDCSMMQQDSLAVMSHIRRIYSNTAIIVLGDDTVPSIINNAFEQGANGYLLAMPLKQQLNDALDCVCKGKQVLDKQLQHLLPALNHQDAMTMV